MCSSGKTGITCSLLYIPPKSYDEPFEADYLTAYDMLKGSILNPMVIAPEQGIFQIETLAKGHTLIDSVTMSELMTYMF